MAIACVIPARYNSQRFPGKLLMRAGGKTILQRTIEQAQKTSILSSLFVATDDERIALHVEGLGIPIIWTSVHCQTGTERIQEALLKEPKLQKSQVIFNLQGDHPTTNPFAIQATIQALLDDPTSVMATAAFPISNREKYLSPHTVKVVFDEKGHALYFSRAPIPYCKPGTLINAYAHIGVYAYRTCFLGILAKESMTNLQEKEDLEQLKVIEKGHRVKIAIVEEEAIGIDTPDDLKKFENFLCKNISLSPVASSLPLEKDLRQHPSDFS